MSVPRAHTPAIRTDQRGCVAGQRGKAADQRKIATDQRDGVADQRGSMPTRSAAETFWTQTARITRPPEV